MITCKFSTGKHTALKRALILFLAACISGLLFSACKTDDTTDYSVEGLDENLIGVWKFDSVGNGGEEIVIEETEAGTTYDYYMVGNYGEKKQLWKGYIRYANLIANNTGAIIIEYLPGYKQVWNDQESWHEVTPGSGMWAADPLDPQPKGNFYGIYYHSLARVPERGNRWEVFLAHTSDQHNNYGPTEVETLNEAIAKFTEENIRDLINLEVGDPQYKDEGL